MSSYKLLKSTRFYLFVIIAAFSSAYAADSTQWVLMQGDVGSEHYAIQFPIHPNLTYQNQEMKLTASEGDNASYQLKVFNPPQACPDAKKAFAIFRAIIGQSPKMILDYKVSEQNGNSIMDVSTVNQRTGVKTQYRYVITPKNVWQLKSAYSNDALHRHTDFLNSFSISEKYTQGI